MSAELNLAIYSAVIDTAKILFSVLPKINELRDNTAKQRCKRLWEASRSLELLVRERPNVVASPEVLEEARSCILEVARYAKDVDQSTGLNGVVEAWWSRRYASLQNKIARVRENFIFESTVRSTMLAASQQPQQSRLGQTLDLSNIQFEPASPATGRGTIEPYGRIVCYRLKDSKLSKESRKAYPKLQERAYVQQFYGVTELNGERYVVMQDLSEYATLNSLCRMKALPSDLVARVEIAFHVARTVAWYHRSSMVLKTINDASIAMKQDSNKLVPLLTGLEHMRHLHEGTTRLRYDCRYEAHEYHTTKIHTKYTDVWSLGIVVWQIIFCGVPYGIELPVDSDDTDQNDLGPDGRPRLVVDKIRSFLQGGGGPGEFPDVLPKPMAALLKKCWIDIPASRPHAMEVADMLLEAWLLLNYKQNQPMYQPPTVSASLSDEDDPTGPGEDGLGRAKSEARLLVYKFRSRDRATKAGSEQARHGQDEQNELSTESSNALLEAASDLDLESTWLVGACVWWGLIPVEQANAQGPVHISMSISPDCDAQRAEVTLAFLQLCFRSGYDDGCFEMYKAHSRLSRYYKTCFDKTPGHMVPQGQGSQ